MLLVSAVLGGQKLQLSALHFSNQLLSGCWRPGSSLGESCETRQNHRCGPGVSLSSSASEAKNHGTDQLKVQALEELEVYSSSQEEGKTTTSSS